MTDLRRNNSRKVHPINTSRCFSSILDHLICSTNLPHSPPGRHHHPRRRISPRLLNSPSSTQPMMSSVVPAVTPTDNTHNHQPTTTNTHDHRQFQRSTATLSSCTSIPAQTHHPPGLVARLMGLESMPPNNESVSRLRSRSLNSLNLFPDSLHRTSLLSRSSSSSSPHQPPPPPPQRPDSRLHHHRRVHSTSTSITNRRDYKLEDLFAQADPASCSSEEFYPPPPPLPLPMTSSFSFYTAKEIETVTRKVTLRSKGDDSREISRGVTSRNGDSVIRDYKISSSRSMMMRRNDEDCERDDHIKKRNIKYMNKKKEVEVTTPVTTIRRINGLSYDDNRARHDSSTSRSSSSSSQPSNGEWRTGANKANDRLIRIKKKKKKKAVVSNTTKEIQIEHVVSRVIPTRKSNKFDDEGNDYHPTIISTKHSNVIELTDHKTQKSPISVLDHHNTFEFEIFSAGSSSPDHNDKTSRTLTFIDDENIEISSLSSSHVSTGVRRLLISGKERKSVNDQCNLTEKKVDESEEFVTKMCDLAAGEFMKNSDWRDVVVGHKTMTKFDDEETSVVGEFCVDLARDTLHVLLDQLVYDLMYVY